MEAERGMTCAVCGGWMHCEPVPICDRCVRDVPPEKYEILSNLVKERNYRKVTNLAKKWGLRK